MIKLASEGAELRQEQAGLGATDPGTAYELSIVMPCLNEAETLAACIRQARAFLDEHRVVGEVIIADNGSTDGSQKIAIDEGATVVVVAERGYGAALTGGIAAARGTFVAMADADSSYDFSTLGPFLVELRRGRDLVMGNRFAGGIAKGAMPALHRYVGNPILSFVGRLFFKAPVGDFHCGLRAFRRSAIVGLGLRTTGMEFASEMVVKACLAELDVCEVPTTLSPDGRSRPPHLRSFRDGWRHLQFLLLYSPRWLFLYPGIVGTFVGLTLSLLLIRGPLRFGDVSFDIGTLLFTLALSIAGYQAVVFAVLSRVYAEEEGFLPVHHRLATYPRRFTLGSSLVVAACLLGCGFVFSAISLMRWRDAGFGDLVAEQTVRTVAPGVLGLILGSQTVLAGLFVSLLRIRVKRPT